MSDGIARAALHGADHETLGEVGTAQAGPAGLALTRGLHKKAYRYEDPNEDVVAAVHGPHGTLLVCADGHNGKLSSHRAVDRLLDLVPEPPERLSDKDWLALFGEANEAIVSAKGIASPQPASETVLLAALVTPDRVSFAAIGDGSLVVCQPGEGRGRQLNKESMRFLGRPLSARALKGTVQRGERGLEAGDWVICVTDGLSEFITPLRPADLLPRLLAQPAAQSGAVDAAKAICDAAGEAGAGDNVGVALVPGSSAR